MTIENADRFFAFDVATYLFIALVITFCIVIVDSFFFVKQSAQEKKIDNNNPIKPKKTMKNWLYFLLFLKFEKNQKYQNRPKIVQWSAEFFPVLLLVFFIRGFIAEPFRIPSNSMMPTLLTGDFVLVEKFSYGVRLPLINTKVLSTTEPQRGDIAVFRYPNYEKNKTYSGADFIKRVIGLPEDKIIYQNDILTINGKKIKYQQFNNYQGFKSGIAMDGYRHLQELLVDQAHDVLLHPNSASRAVELIVPKGHYFVMGDNRSNSSDSRFWGFVPDKYLIGKAFAVWMHFDGGFNFSRLGGIK